MNSDLGTATIYRALAAEMVRFQEELNATAKTGQWCVQRCVWRFEDG